LRSNLVAAGMPAQYTAPIETQFRACLHDRLVAADPTVTPASCRLPAGRVLPAAVHPVLTRAGEAAVRTDFADAVARTLWFQVGVFGLSFLLMLAWPRGAGRKAHEGADGGAAAGQAAGAGDRSAVDAGAAAAVPAVAASAAVPVGPVGPGGREQGG